MKHIILLCLFLILLTSCAKDKITVSDTSRKITINGLITTDSLLNVKISKSDNITDLNYSSSFRNIDNAKVLIYQNENFVDSLHFDSTWAPAEMYPNVDNEMYPHGNYISRTILPSQGKDYKIVVSAPGSPDAFATTTIPDMVRIEHVDTCRTIETDKISDGPNVHFICNIEFTDPGNEQNYYLFNVYKKHSLYGKKYSRAVGFQSDDPVIEKKLIRLYNGSYIMGIFFSDKMINGSKFNFSIDIDDWEIGPPFNKSCWDGEATNSECECETGNHRKVICFRLYSLTAEYFKYIQTVDLFDKNYDNPLSDPVQVYSNITGGYGIFAGAAVSCDSIVFTY